MNKQQLQNFAELLREKKRELQQAAADGDSGSKIVALDQSRQGRLSRMDALQGQAMSLAAKKRRILALGRIEQALQRIENDDYGYCSICGEEISIGRLEFDPAVTECVSCAEKSEPN